MDSSASSSPVPSLTPDIGSSLPVLDEYIVGARRDRRPRADVYDAVHRYSGAPFLVYVLRPQAMADRALVHRAGCEIDAARWIRHAAVPKLDRPGETPSRRLYVAVEHRTAPTLRAVVAARGALPAQEVVGLAAPLVDALEQAHALGLVHGRLTPDAIGVHAPDAPKGAAKVVLHGLGLTSITDPGDVASDERAFASPEQLAGAEPSVRSDVFGLAAVLDFALHGEIRIDHRFLFDPRVRDTVGGVLAAARAPEPRDRPASVRALWDDVLRALVAGASHAEAPIMGERGTNEETRAVADGDRLTVPAPMPRTRWRRGVSRAHAGWLALPLLGALGWPLARGGAHASAPARARTAAGETVAPAPAAALIGRAAPSASVAPQRAERPVPSRPLASSVHRPRPALAPTPPTAVRPTDARPQDSAPASAPAALRVDVPTFIIIDPSRAQSGARAVARPDEFVDGIPRTRKP